MIKDLLASVRLALELRLLNVEALRSELKLANDRITALEVALADAEVRIAWLPRKPKAHVSVGSKEVVA